MNKTNIYSQTTKHTALPKNLDKVLLSSLVTITLGFAGYILYKFSQLNFKLPPLY